MDYTSLSHFARPYENEEQSLQMTNKSIDHYYLAGYYLVDGPSDWWKNKTNESIDIQTCGCIKDSTFGLWCYSWCLKLEEIEKNKKKYQLTESDIGRIQAWADAKFDSGKLQWENTFPNLEMVLEFRNLFFDHLQNTEIYSLYFSKTDIDYFKIDFSYEINKDNTKFNILNYIAESDDPKEELMGFDCISVEDFITIHSIYCHGSSFVKEVAEKFGLTLNAHGLFDEIDDWEPLRQYLNHEVDLEGPCYIGKIKRLNV